MKYYITIINNFKIYKNLIKIHIFGWGINITKFIE